MKKLRRVTVVALLLAAAIVISSSLHGQSGLKPAPSRITPQNTFAPFADAAPEASASRFSTGGVQTYATLEGEHYFALQLAAKLEVPAPRPRDFLVMMSTAATQAGPHWIAAHQIAGGLIDNAREFDRVSLWSANEPKFTKNLSRDFLAPKDYGDKTRLTTVLKTYRDHEYPAGDTDLKSALENAIRSFDAGKDRQRILLFLGDGLSTAQSGSRKPIARPSRG